MAVLLIALLVRLPILLGYEPVSYGDTGTYMQAARDLVTGDFSVGQGRRTPGYSVVVAAMGSDPHRIMAFQLFGGVALSMLMYLMVWLLTRSAAWAAAAGLAHALNLQQLFQEGALLTEATSALSVIAALALLMGVIQTLRSGRLPVLALVGLSILSAYALFVRPQFICLLIVAPAAVVYAASGWRIPTLRASLAGTLALLPAVLAVLAW